MHVQIHLQLQTMVGEPEQFTRSQYGTAPYDNDTCYSNADSTDAATFHYGDWEMRVYNQMHGHPTTTDTEYLIAARKVQVGTPYIYVIGNSLRDFVMIIKLMGCYEIK